jgi:hypothetical protein
MFFLLGNHKSKTTVICLNYYLPAMFFKRKDNWKSAKYPHEFGVSNHNTNRRCKILSKLAVGEQTQMHCLSALMSWFGANICHSIREFDGRNLVWYKTQRVKTWHENLLLLYLPTDQKLLRLEESTWDSSTTLNSFSYFRLSESSILFNVLIISVIILYIRALLGNVVIPIRNILLQ